MSKPKITIAFYTMTGTNHQIAEEARRAAEAAGAEVRFRRFAETAPQEVIDGQEQWKAQLEKMQDIPEISHDDMEWAEGYFFSFPTRYGNAPGQVRAFIDTLGPLWQQGKLADKTATATTSAMNTHGGQESTLLGFYTTLMHWGAILVTPGYTDEALYAAGGNPYGYSAKAGEFDDAGRTAVAHQAKRLVTFTEKLVG
ncbi:trp repressor-binding protein WrbA [Pseudooceanicola nanhaiensis]|jgi:NAD(P)H dehydrogenase (quinone)|uniref:Trp repressor-binding protein WrbA n=1 Tax=Pseudooceanicola nanhaiensis TaxID=375761 RepID=A0A917SL91_9RHOB|nr:NAD(P)H-dependent oxidoreductase [Pseudooceanicola nanhaiensis]GGL86057.1 trp repressor-binding protein WrbA [Pseudooceanicola nanhaiensis]